MPARREIAIDDVNLIPILNLIVCLIPLLILQSSFLIVGVADVNPSGATGGASGSIEGQKKIPLDLRVYVMSNAKLEVHYNDVRAFDLRAAFQRKTVVGVTVRRCGGLASEERCGRDSDRPCRALPCDEVVDYDYDGLGRLADEIKKSDPGEDRVLINIEPTTPFYVVVRAMDATRGKFDPNRVLIDPKTEKRIQGAYEWFENVNIALGTVRVEGG